MKYIPYLEPKTDAADLELFVRDLCQSAAISAIISSTLDPVPFLGGNQWYIFVYLYMFVYVCIFFCIRLVIINLQLTPS